MSRTGIPSVMHTISSAPASAASLEERLTEAEQELESIENELPRDVVENSNQVVSQDLETACEERDRARRWDL